MLDRCCPTVGALTGCGWPGLAPFLVLFLSPGHGSRYRFELGARSRSPSFALPLAAVCLSLSLSVRVGDQADIPAGASPRTDPPQRAVLQVTSAREISYHPSPHMADGVGPSISHLPFSPLAPLPWSLAGIQRPVPHNARSPPSNSTCPAPQTIRDGSDERRRPPPPIDVLPFSSRVRIWRFRCLLLGYFLVGFRSLSVASRWRCRLLLHCLLSRK